LTNSGHCSLVGSCTGEAVGGGGLAGLTGALTGGLAGVGGCEVIGGDAAGAVCCGGLAGEAWGLAARLAGEGGGQEESRRANVTGSDIRRVASLTIRDGACASGSREIGVRARGAAGVTCACCAIGRTVHARGPGRVLASRT
jgi:hypothetical protein